VNDDPILAGVGRHPGGARACDQRLGGNATGIYASAAKLPALDNRDFPPGLGKFHSKGRTCLACPDDNSVVLHG
jgi:hypothetical protein